MHLVTAIVGPITPLVDLRVVILPTTNKYLLFILGFCTVGLDYVTWWFILYTPFVVRVSISE
jgi:hypothetical protein